MRQKSDFVYNIVDVWCIKSGMETRQVISYQREMTVTRLEIFVTLVAGLTLRRQDGCFEMASVICVALRSRYSAFSLLYIQQ